MFARSLVLLSSLILLSVLLDAANGQEAADTLPSAEEVIERHILFKGGYEYLSSLTTMHVVWTTEKDDHVWKFERWRMPSQKFARKTCDGKPFLTKGCWVADEPSETGELQGVSWNQNANRNPVFHRATTLQENLMNTASIDGATLWTERSSSIKIVGIEKVEDSDCYHLTFTGLDGSETERFFDVKTSQLLRTVSIEHETGGTVVMRNYSDYKQIGEILMPMKLQIVSATGIDVWKVESAEVDLEIDVEQFDIPLEVQVEIDRMETLHGNGD